MAKKLPPDIQRVLDQIEPQLRDEFIAAIQRITDSVELGRIEALIREGRIDDAIRALNINPTLFSGLHEAERAGLVAGGNLVLSGLRIRDPFSGSRVVLGFDGRALRAENWAATASSRLITEIVEDQMAMAREVIRAGIEAGKNPHSIALELVGRIDKATGRRAGGFIGLTSQQARWVTSAEAQLRGLDAGYLGRSRRDKRYDRLVLRAIKGGKPLAEADIRQITQRYRDRLLNYRAETIARTSMLTAHRDAALASRIANADVCTGWAWLASLSPRTCQVCISMHGTVFPHDSPGPLDHPNGRCAAVPLTRYAPDGDPFKTGPDWFAEQPERVQRQILGPRRLAAYQRGDYPPERWAALGDNPGWQPSYKPTKAPK